MRSQIILLALAGLPVAAQGRLEVWLEPGYTHNRVTLPWSGQRVNAPVHLGSLRCQWAIPRSWGDVCLSVVGHTNSLDGNSWLQRSGPLMAQGVTYQEEVEVKYSPQPSFGFYVRFGGRVSVGAGFDIRPYHLRLRGMRGMSHDGDASQPSIEVLPGIQLTTSLAKNLSLGLRASFRMTLDDSGDQAGWFESSQSAPEYHILAGWRFGR